MHSRNPIRPFSGRWSRAALPRNRTHAAGPPRSSCCLNRHRRVDQGRGRAEGVLAGRHALQVLSGFGGVTPAAAACYLSMSLVRPVRCASNGGPAAQRTSAGVWTRNGRNYRAVVLRSDPAKPVWLGPALARAKMTTPRGGGPAGRKGGPGSCCGPASWPWFLDVGGRSLLTFTTTRGQHRQAVGLAELVAARRVASILVEASTGYSARRRRAGPVAGAAGRALGRTASPARHVACG